MITAIVGVAKSGVIGFNNTIPWQGKLPRDLKHFKEQTLQQEEDRENCLIMGRNTWDSLPRRPLDGRINIVVSRTREIPGIPVAQSLSEAIEIARSSGRKNIFLIGGMGIYQEGFRSGIVDRVIITRIHENFEGNVFFNEPLSDKYNLVYKTNWNKDDKNLYDATLEIWLKK